MAGLSMIGGMMMTAKEIAGWLFPEKEDDAGPPPPPSTDDVPSSQRSDPVPA